MEQNCLDFFLGAENVPSEHNSIESKKAMAYDLITQIDANSEKKTYTAEEVKQLIRNYIAVSVS